MFSDQEPSHVALKESAIKGGAVNNSNRKIIVHHQLWLWCYNWWYIETWC